MAVSYILDIANIPGESNDENSAYAQKIEIDSWSFGADQGGVIQSGTGRAAGRVSVSDFTFTKHADLSTVKLAESCATGTHHDRATLTCRRTGLTDGSLEPYMKVVFTDLVISSYQTSGNNGDSGLPAEHIAFNFATIQFSYIPQDKGANLGTLQATYDLKKSLTS